MKLFIYDDYKNIYPELSGHALTDALILRAVKEYGISVSSLKVIRDHRGKPFIVPHSEVKVNVSVSHCGSTFAAIVSDANCGIDIQEARNTDVLKIAERFFSEEEYRLVEKEGSDRFFRLWTRKEAYAKYTGGGLGQVMRKISVIDREDVTFTESILPNGMYCCICTKEEPEWMQ